MNNSIFKIAAQFGGGEKMERFKPLYFKFKEMIEQCGFGEYSEEINEFSFVFRIDGKFSAWGENGCNRLKLFRKKNYITIDIGITTETLDLPELAIWDLIWDYFCDGFAKMVVKLKSAGIKFNSQELALELKNKIPRLEEKLNSLIVDE